MPNYTGLKVWPSDNSKTKTKKKRIAKRLQLLQSELSKHISANVVNPNDDQTVRIATWNIREYGNSKYGGRDLEERYYIAEIISHFDIVALQEVRSNLKEFIKLKRILGGNWDYIATDVTDGSPGNGERMVFLFNRNKVFFKNIAGELTLKEGQKIRASFGERIRLENGLEVKLPNNHAGLSGTYDARLASVKGGGKKLKEDVEIPLPAGSTLKLPDGASMVVAKNTPVTSPGRGKADIEIPKADISGKSYRLRFPEDTFDDSLRQFARTPFLISFQSGWLKINLCTVHIYYGSADDKKKLEQRRSEIEQLSKALAGKAKGEFAEDEESFLGVLGDFNIIGDGHPTMEALESNGFEIPENLKSIPGSNVKRNMAYDQIAFWNPKRKGKYSCLDIKGANIFDFFEHVFTHDDEQLYRRESALGLKPSSSYNTWRTYKMSDHLPMWIEIRTDFRSEYLDLVGQ